MAFIYFCQNTSYARADYENQFLNVDYSKFDINKTKESANNYFKLALSSAEDEKKNEYLIKAQAKYHILTNLEKSDPYSYVMLARIYDIQKKDTYAKSYFYTALGIEPQNIDANYYFGEFYYSRKQFKKALDYYNKALNYGKAGNSEIYQKIGKIYARFGDTTRANFYYKESKRIKK